MQVRFIETAADKLPPPPPRNTDDTFNGLRYGPNTACSPFIKQQQQKCETESSVLSSLNFIEKICAIDDLCLSDNSLHETKANSDSHVQVKPVVSEEFTSNICLGLNSNFSNQLLSTATSCKKSDLTVITPVIEEISKTSNNDNDTDSEISELPTDDEREKEDQYEEESDKASEKDTNLCDKGPKKVPTVDISEMFVDKRENVEVESKLDDDYSSFDEESQSSLSASSGAASYSSHGSSFNSLSNSPTNTSPSSENEVNLVDRFKKQKSPDSSLHESRTNEETKTTFESHKEVKPDSRDIREEIKVEFERQHKYIRSRDFVKKSPEDSGFESFQQSSVEQNSNQDSDEDDVVATFSTVLEVENETSTMNDDAGPSLAHAHAHHARGDRESYTTAGLFTEAEQARARSRRLREESLKQLGCSLATLGPGLGSLGSKQQHCDIKIQTANNSVQTSNRVVSTGREAPVCQKPKYTSGHRTLEVCKIVWPGLDIY